MATSPFGKTLQEWEKWRLEHAGATPSQKSPHDEERRLANRYSKVPRSRKGDEAMETFQQVLAFHHTFNALPQRSRDPARAEECKLAGQLRDRRRATSLSAEASLLLERIKLLESSKESPHTGPQKNIKLAAVRAKQRELQDDYLQWSQEQQLPPGPLPRLQSNPSVGLTFKGRSPYPGFSNMGSSCYMSSVLQCLLHCERARLYMESVQVGAAADGSSVRSAVKELFD